MWSTDVGFFCAFFYSPLQALSLIRLRDRWQLILTLVPVPLMLVVYLFTGYAYAQESNVWPILMLMASPLAVLYLLIVLVIRILFVRKK